MFPLECFHGNSHAEKVGVVRDERGDIAGLKVDLMMDGKLHVGGVGRRVYVSHTLNKDGQHSKLGDARPKIKERIVRFGDSPQVRCPDILLLLCPPAIFVYSRRSP